MEKERRYFGYSAYQGVEKGNLEKPELYISLCIHAGEKKETNTIMYLPLEKEVVGCAGVPAHMVGKGTALPRS